MLYFSKLKLVVIYFIIVFLSLFALVNFIDDKDNYIEELIDEEEEGESDEGPDLPSS